MSVDPMTCTMEADKLVDMLDAVKRMVPEMDYYKTVQMIVRNLATAKQPGNEELTRGLGMAGIWTAFQHPKWGSQMRARVSDALRQDGKAHITWQYSPTIGLTMALADKFVDPEPLAERAAEAALEGSVLVVAPGNKDDEQPH